MLVSALIYFLMRIYVYANESNSSFKWLIYFLSIHECGHNWEDSKFVFFEFDTYYVMLVFEVKNIIQGLHLSDVYLKKVEYLYDKINR